MKRYIVSVVFREVEAESAKKAADLVLKCIESKEVDQLNCLLYASGTDTSESYSSLGKSLRRTRVGLRPNEIDSIG